MRRWIRSRRLRSRRVGTQHLVDAADLDAVTTAGDEGIALPDGWERLVDGSPRPDWGRLVRDSRQSH